MKSDRLGRALIAAAALSTITVPIGVDGVLLAKAHMKNSRWLPHAKLHCAMSFFAALSLGTASLTLLRRPQIDRGTLATATWMATAFWIGLLAAGQWPGASYGLTDDPAFADVKPPRVLGVPVDPNVALAALSTALGWLGYRLAAHEIEE